MGALIYRDIRLAYRNLGQWLLPPIFLFLFLLICVIALGGQNNLMHELAPALIWLAFIMSVLMSLHILFLDDLDLGIIEQIKLSGVGILPLITAKSLSFFLIIYMPLLLITPIVGVWFNLSHQLIVSIALSIIVSAPSIIIYCLVTAAILARYKHIGFLSLIITAPFLLPILIFALSAIKSYPDAGLWALEFRALIGLDFIACAIGLPAAAAALSTHLE